MKVSVTRQIPLPQIPSASGIERAGDHYFVIGDDTPYLFRLNPAFQPGEKIELFKAVTGNTGRIRKKDKADLESLTLIKSGTSYFLLALGSGSRRENRDVAYLVELTTLKVSSIRVSRFFDCLRSLLKSRYASELNIEASVFFRQKLYLFQRGNVSGFNIIVSIPFNDFLHFDENENDSATFSLHEVTLPVLHGLQAGFSGACLMSDSDTVLFTASLEQTSNALVDGPSGGSFAGFLHLGQMDSGVSDIALIQYEAKTFMGKVESVTDVRSIDKNIVQAIAVCDEDGNPSSLLQLTIEQ